MAIDCFTTRFRLRSASYDPTSRSRHRVHRVRLRRISRAGADN